MNTVNLIGRLTRDANVVNNNNGGQVALFTLAVSNGRDQNGNERAQFIPCQLHGKSVANVAKYMTKGTLVGFEGTLNVYNSNKEKLSNGYPVTMFNVSGFRVELLGRPQNEQNNSNQNQNRNNYNNRQQTQRPATTNDLGGADEFTEDINF